MGDENTNIDNLINSLLSVCTALKSKWTQRQCQVVDAYFSSGQNQYKAADLLGVGQPRVNKALNGARFYTYKSALDTINAFLNRRVEG